MSAFLRWFDEHYEIPDDGLRIRCKRCGAIVHYVTRHAALVHGDDIEVMPSVSGEPRDDYFE